MRKVERCIFKLLIINKLYFLNFKHCPNFLIFANIAASLSLGIKN